jgi:hypothetical protein
MICSLQESYVWLLEQDPESLVDEFRKRLGEIDFLSLAEIQMKGFRAICIRYQRSEAESDWLLEDIYVPRRGGTLYMHFASLKRDAPYYLPIFSRIKASLDSRVPPPVNLPP